jgi:UDP-3-O-[3-hydroxymyristoyl] glucosamine N-acyltransferase LpxD
VVVNIDVEDQPTGAFSVSGGYSTADGAIGEVAVSESNFLGRGQFVRVAGQIGQRTNGIDFSFTEPYFLGYRLAAGFDLFTKYSDQTQYSRYENRTTGAQIRIGLPLTEESGVTLRYSLYEQDLKVPNTSRRPFNDCSVPLPNTPRNPDGTANFFGCSVNGEASIAVKESRGRTLTSLAGITLAYNTVDDLRNPRSGIYAEAKPEVAGLGGDSNFFRVTGEARYYQEIYEDIIGVAKIQGGHIQATGRNRSSSALGSFGGDLRLVDHFFLGPTLVRGFAPSGIGPRDVGTPDSNQNALGGTTYFGGTLEAQFPIPLIPRDLGLKGAVFADAGTLFGYNGPRGLDVNGNGTFQCSGISAGGFSVQPECISCGIASSSARRGCLYSLELAARPDQVRLRLCAVEGRGHDRQLQRYSDARRQGRDAGVPLLGRQPLLNSTQYRRPPSRPADTMSDPVFFPPEGSLSLGEVAGIAGVTLPEGAPDLRFRTVSSLEEAGPSDLAYMDNPGYLDALALTRAGACLVSSRFAASVPTDTYALKVQAPYRVYAAVLARLHPSALRPRSAFGASGVTPGSFVHPTARLEPEVAIDPAAVVGPGAEIGRGTVLGAGAVIGAGTRIGRDCSIGAGASVLHALVGNRVIVHPGARIGQDGFGFAFANGRHGKVPQVGRVIIQDDVEIGSGTAIDRGGTRDTIIGEGTKIDNLVQIAHNVVIGRHCIIVAQTGIAGSARLDDYVVLGGQVGVIGHVRVGEGAQIAATSNVNSDVPPGARWGGSPAKPVRDWFRELHTLKRLASRSVRAKEGGDGDTL